MIAREPEQYVGNLNALLKLTEPSAIKLAFKDITDLLRLEDISLITHLIDIDDDARLVYQAADNARKMLEKKAFKYATIFREEESKLRARYMARHKRPVPPKEESRFERNGNTITAYLSRFHPTQKQIIDLIETHYSMRKYGILKGVLFNTN